MESAFVLTDFAAASRQKVKDTNFEQQFILQLVWQFPVVIVPKSRIRNSLARSRAPLLDVSCLRTGASYLLCKTLRCQLGALPPHNTSLLHLETLAWWKPALTPGLCKEHRWHLSDTEPSTANPRLPPSPVSPQQLRLQPLLLAVPCPLAHSCQEKASEMQPSQVRVKSSFLPTTLKQLWASDLSWGIASPGPVEVPGPVVTRFVGEEVQRGLVPLHWQLQLNIWRTFW